uniref:Dynein regulatory complex subunit 4 n=1 Tax=Astyanax mexicanus TaxID=7994 RepID=A0A3B1JTT7_ASTMX
MASKKKGRKSAQIVSLREELDRERKKCNYFRLERDKIHGFWEISKERLDDFKCELSNKYKKIEEKVKHLLYEQQLSITELRAEGEVSNKLLLKKHEDLESDLRKDVQNLKVKLKETELSNKNLIKSVKLKHNEEMTDIRTYFEQLLQDMEAKYENKMVALKLLRPITKEGKKKMKENVKRLKSEMAKVLRENKQLTEPLRMATEEATKVRARLKVQERDKLYLKFNKAIQKVQQKKVLKNLLLKRKLAALKGDLEKNNTHAPLDHQHCGADSETGSNLLRRYHLKQPNPHQSTKEG